MSNAESGAGKGGEFSLDGQLIGGPKEFWKRITNDEAPVKGAWEFTNQRGQNDQLDGYNFHFPRGSRIDIYVEAEGEQKIFTAMGGQGANLDPRWKVTEMQLYVNSRKWEEQHEGEWMEWKNSGETLNPTNEWRPVGTTPPKRVEAPSYTPTPDAPPVNSSWTERKKLNAQRALKWALAGLLAYGGVGAAISLIGLLNQPPYEEIRLEPNQSYNVQRIDASGQSGIIIVGPGDTLYLEENTNPMQINVQSGNNLIITIYRDITVRTSDNEPEPIIIQDKFNGAREDDIALNDIQNLKNSYSGNIIISYLSNDDGTLRDTNNQDLCNLGAGITCTNP